MKDLKDLEKEKDIDDEITQPINDEEEIIQEDEVEEFTDLEQESEEELINKNLIEEIINKKNKQDEIVEARQIESERIVVHQKEKRRKHKDDDEPVIEIIRRIPDVNEGLTTDEADDRKAVGLSNDIKQ